MATEAMSRSATSLGVGNLGGSQKQNLPVIAHPMTKLDRDNLSVRGQGPIYPPSREKTFVTVNDGQVKLGLDRSNLPPLGSSARDWTGRSLAHEVDTYQTLSGGRWFASRIVNTPDFSPKTPRWDAGTGFSVPELMYMIAEKLGSGYHGIKHLFRGNDPSGQGVVSREALLKIIYTVCGYISPDQFNKLLKTIGLQGMTSISFDDFVQCFKDNQKPSKVWLSPAQRVEIAKPPKRAESQYRGGAVSAAFCYTLLKDRARAGEYRIHDVLPEACFEVGGRIIAPQFHDMINHLGYKLTEEDFIKLWQRFETTGCGAVDTVRFLKKLGLDATGRVRPSTTPRHVVLQAPADLKPKKTNRTVLPRRLPPIIQIKEEQFYDDMGKEESGPEEEDDEEEPNDGTKSRNSSEEPVRKKRFIKKRGATPKLERITHCLYYKFDEPYNAMMEGMKCFDFIKDGFIARIDFKKVLEEFNLPISMIDLDYFLSRCGVRTIHGQLVYQDFMMKFYNRAESGLVQRIVSNNPHMFNGGGGLPPVERGNSLTAEELEIRLVDYLHTDFLNLMSAFRNADKYNLGVITKYELRQTIDRLLGYPMSEDQFTELLAEVNLDKDGLVPFTSFLESFNKPPGSWNKRQVGGHTIVAVRREGLPPEVLGLKEEADTMIAKVRAEVQAEEEENERGLRRSKGMNLEELNVCISQFFRLKFHSFDKAFKSIDRRMTGRFNVHQFADILKGCGLSLLPDEVELLWGSLPVSGDNMLSFAALIRHLNSLNKGPPLITDKLPMEDSTELIERARQAIREKRERSGREMEQFRNEPIRVEISKINCERVLEQLRPDVTQHWEKLKTLLRHMDPSGKTTVAPVDMRDVILMLRFPITEPELQVLLQKFIDEESGMFKYMDFLKYFTRQRSEGPSSMSFGLSQKQEQKIAKELKNLKRAFKKADPSGNGHLTVEEFKQVLESVGVNINGEDVFRILSELDQDMSGKISYEHFLSKI